MSAPNPTGAKPNLMLIVSLIGGVVVLVFGAIFVLTTETSPGSQSRGTNGVAADITESRPSGSGSEQHGSEAAFPGGLPQTTPRISPNSLNVSVPMSHPACDGSGIVVLANAVTPGRYDAEIQHYLDMHPGASYLRTDESCSSLRARDDAGNPIYAVYRQAGRSRADVCAAVRAAGGNAYGKWLDTTTNPRDMITC